MLLASAALCGAATTVTHMDACTGIGATQELATTQELGHPRRNLVIGTGIRGTGIRDTGIRDKRV